MNRFATQYLHRESILVNNAVADLALDEGRSIILEKTLMDSEHVLALARQFTRRGVRVHLFGTHISPQKNWDFLSYRMQSGQSFGRFITASQTVSALRNYHTNLEALISDEEKRAVFDGARV